MKNDDFFHFKGERNYISSSNIFDFILAELNANNPKSIDFRLSRFTKNKCYLETDKAKAANVSNIGQYQDDTNLIFIMESRENVSERRSYDEKELIKKLTTTHVGIEVPDGILSYTFIEKANAAFKALLKKTVYPDTPARFIFVRLKLDHVPNDGFTIQNKRTVGGLFYEGEIIERNMTVGHIYFSVKDN